VRSQSLGRNASKKSWIRAIENGEVFDFLGQVNGHLPAAPRRVLDPDNLRDPELSRRRPAKRIVEFIHEDEVEKSHKTRLTSATLLAHLYKQYPPPPLPSPPPRPSPLTIPCSYQLTLCEGYVGYSNHQQIEKWPLRPSKDRRGGVQEVCVCGWGVG
jgi:hypothetical protein